MVNSTYDSRTNLNYMKSRIASQFVVHGKYLRFRKVFIIQEVPVSFSFLFITLVILVIQFSLLVILLIFPTAILKCCG